MGSRSCSHVFVMAFNRPNSARGGEGGVARSQLGQHPTCFRDVWLISSFGAQHPDASSQSYGGTLSLETMFAAGDVVAVHLDLHEGVLSFSKNGVACKHATFTELRGKTLRPVLCMDNAGWVASALC